MNKPSRSQNGRAILPPEPFSPMELPRPKPGNPTPA
jgi:hypothetical protein